MGVYSHTYLGPYFRCRTRAVAEKRTVVACPNRECYRYDKPSPSASVKFCPDCGTELDRNFPIEVTVTRPHGVAVSEAIKEQLSEITSNYTDFGKDYHLWIPNVARPGQPERDADDKCGVEVPVDGLDIGGEQRWLLEAFGPEVGKLMTAYGMHNVETRWGLLKYCS
jgi:hypothetical protein